MFQISQRIELNQQGIMFFNDIASAVASLAGVKPVPVYTSDKPIKKPSTGYVNSNIAKEFGKGNTQSKWVQKLDKRLAVATFCAVEEIKKARNSNKELDWKTIVQLMHKCDGLASYYSSGTRQTFKHSGGPNLLGIGGVAEKKAKMNEIMSWIKRVLNDTDPMVSYFCLSL